MKALFAQPLATGTISHLSLHSYAYLSLTKTNLEIGCPVPRPLLLAHWQPFPKLTLCRDAVILASLFRSSV
jgi:hypothetical protein